MAPQTDQALRTAAGALRRGDDRPDGASGLRQGGGDSMTTPAWKTPRGHAPALDFEGLAAMVENCAFHKWLGVKLKALDETGVAIWMPRRAEGESEPVVGYG